MTTYPVPLEQRLPDMLATLQRRVTLLEARSVPALTFAQDPVNGGPETWHLMTLQNAWTNRGTGYARAAYRLLPSNNTVEIIGDITHASISGTSQIATLPSAYTPKVGQVIDGSVDGASGQLYVDSTGAVTLFSLVAGTTIVQWHGYISLDAT